MGDKQVIPHPLVWYRIAGMFGGDKVWRIASSKVIGEKKFGECLQQHCAAYKMD